MLARVSTQLNSTFTSSRVGEEARNTVFDGGNSSDRSGKELGNVSRYITFLDMPFQI